MNSLSEKLLAFERILKIMDELRAACPWDSVQTNESLRQLTLEEAYELAEAVISGNTDALKKELGDVFLHIIFYAKIASEKNEFDIADVLNSLADKLIYRHPHIYSDAKADDAEQVRLNWAELKLKEKSAEKNTVLGGVPASLPSLVKAVRLQEKASAVGFDWDDRSQIWAKIHEEIDELRHEIEQNDTEKSEQEFGDLLFALTNMARLYDIRPDNALEKTNQKFIRRFNYVEEKIASLGKSLKSCTLEDMDFFWNEAKKIEKKN